jgi:hypothetical protein
MDINLRTKWVAALRSGDYKQGRGELCKDGKYCCLGVLMDITDRLTNNGDGRSYVLGTNATKFFRSMPDVVIDEISFPTNGRTLVKMNDVQKKTFNDIADYIEECF